MQIRAARSHEVRGICISHGNAADLWYVFRMPGTVSELLLPEYDAEMAITRRVLERIPEDKFGWKPHEKSTTLGDLAHHVALSPLWAKVIIGGSAKKPATPSSKAGMLEQMDGYLPVGRAAIAEATDAHMLEMVGPDPNAKVPRVTMVRSKVLAHMIHHRGQLSVYLRLLDVAVPAIYGQSADEQAAATGSAT